MAAPFLCFPKQSFCVVGTINPDLTACIKEPAIENFLKIFIKNLTKFKQSDKVYLDYKNLVVCLLLVTGVVPER